MHTPLSQHDVQQSHGSQLHFLRREHPRPPCPFIVVELHAVERRSRAADVLRLPTRRLSACSSGATPSVARVLTSKPRFRSTMMRTFEKHRHGISRRRST
eukprot:999350-Rhodomonas_salina.2